jgi:esterase/lipase superfamily enzyme
VGKTQLAAEYAHRFAGTYDLAWWVSSERTELIGDQFAALGVALGWLQPGAGTEVVRQAVLAELRNRGRWLLVFDNAENPADIAPWLPGGGGHMLITSREHGWAQIAVPVEVDLLARTESVAILQGRVAGLSEADAGRLAAQLGDLPLAIAQAAGFMAETDTPAAEYLSLLRTQAGQLLDQADPGSDYPRSLAAATQLIVGRLDRDDPAAAQLANLCAFLAPEPIPEDLFTRAPAELPGELAARAADPLAWRQTLAHLTRQSLVRVDQRGLQLHRLTQAILRDRLPPQQAPFLRAWTEAILAASDPGDVDDPSNWPQWARLMPHLLAADLAATDDPQLRWMACNACWYLLVRGDTRSAYDLANDLHQRWRARFGEDDENTQAVASCLAQALQQMGRYAEARDLDQDILDRRRRWLGEDHPDTLTAATNLALALHLLGEVDAARYLGQDTLGRRRRMLGEDHPDTLTTRSNLAAWTGEAGDAAAARDQYAALLPIQERVLGFENPDTLTTRSNLAAWTGEAGDAAAARDQYAALLRISERVLGPGHPDTLTTRSNLAFYTVAAGDAAVAWPTDDENSEREVSQTPYPSSPPPPAGTEYPDANLVEVWFGTNRQPLNDSDAAEGFTDQRDATGRIHYGVCNVVIPKAHKFGSIGKPQWRRWLQFDFKDDRITVTARRSLGGPRAFFEALRKELADSEGKQLLFYLHGYNTSFDEAARRAGQLFADLKVDGAPAFFSWPSKALTRDYLADGDRIADSEADIAQFLKGLATELGGATVHIIAHSMGNRGLARAIQRIAAAAASNASVRFGQIILAAPDISVELFRDLARVYPLISQRTTMYVSARDRALGLSKWLQDAPRAGFTPPVTVVPDIDTIEVTNIDLTLLGHGYYAAAEAVLYDIADLLRHNSAPAHRLRLRLGPSLNSPARYWVIGA